MPYTVNGRDIIAIEMTEFNSGTWTGEVKVDAEEDIAPDGKITIDFGEGVELIGSVMFAGVESGRYHLTVIGGTGGIAKKLPPKYYAGGPTFAVKAGVIIADILREAGETLDPASDQTVLDHLVPRWVRSESTAAACLRGILDEAGAMWRMGRNGMVRVFREDSFPTIAGDYELIFCEPENEVAFIAPDKAPTVHPGVSIEGRNVCEVQTSYLKRGLRQRVKFHREDTTSPFPTPSTTNVTRGAEIRVGRLLDYTRAYPGVVKGQPSGDQVDVLVGDRRIANSGGMTKIPLRHGLPGVSVQVRDDAVVNISFEGGDPKQPIAAGWHEPQDGGGSAADRIVITVNNEIVFAGPAVLIGSASAAEAMVLGTTLKAYLDQVKAWMDAAYAVLGGWTVVPQDGGAALRAAWNATVPSVPSVPEIESSAHRIDQ